MKKELCGETGWGSNREIPFHAPEGTRATCPFTYAGTELCRAALASMMIARQYCSGGGHEGCPIFLVNTAKSERSKRWLA